MAKTKQNLPNYTRGEVVLDGISFNDTWARSLVSRKLKETDPKETSSQDQFIAEFWDHPNLATLKDPDRRAFLVMALEACLSAK